MRDGPELEHIEPDAPPPGNAAVGPARPAGSRRPQGAARRWGPIAVVALAVVALAGAGVAAVVVTRHRHQRPTVVVDHRVAAADGPLAIRLEHLTPRSDVLVEADAVLGGQQWRSAGTFTVDERGEVDLQRRAPFGGSWDTADSTGLLWSMGLTGLDPGPESDEAITVHVRVSAGSKVLARTTLTRVVTGPDVEHRTTSLAQDGFVGTFFHPSDTSRSRPAVLVFGGSEGGEGFSPIIAGLLASHGYAALSLAYFGAPGLPATLSSIPLEYFGGAIDWLRSQPGVDPARIWIYSGSRGSEAAFLLAANMTAAVYGVVAYSPSAVVFGSPTDPTKAAWTRLGQPVAFDPLERGTATREPDGGVDLRPLFEAALDHTTATSPALIPVAKIAGPVLLISGGADALWPSDVSAQRIKAALDAAHDPTEHESLVYPDAGHFVLGPPDLPALIRSGSTNLGGSVWADNAAHAAAWPATLAFIADH